MACICVYGAASDRIKDDYIDKVEGLGKILALNGHSIIYGGGASGLMGAVARGVTENGGKVIGVAPRFMHKFEPMFDCTETITAPTLADRKEIMESRAEAFIVVPGGVGTFDEFFQIITLKELGQLDDKPIILLNINDYFKELYEMMKASNRKGFLREGVIHMFTICDTAEEAVKEVEKQLSELEEQKKQNKSDKKE